jgi:hypothetical protein
VCLYHVWDTSNGTAEDFGSRGGWTVPRHRGTFETETAVAEFLERIGAEQSFDGESLARNLPAVRALSTSLTSTNARCGLRGATRAVRRAVCKACTVLLS